MEKEDIIKFINENPEFSLATCEGNEPRVRTMLLYQANKEGIFFNTCKEKNLHKQLKKNPSIEMCFYDRDNMQVRIRGKVKLVEGSQHREQMCNKTQELSNFVKEGKIAMYRLLNARANVWQMDADYVLRLVRNLELESIWMAMHMGINP